MDENLLLNSIRQIISEEISNKLKEHLEPIKSQLEENTLILKALQHSAEVNKSEHDKMASDIAHIKGDIRDIKKDLTQVEEITANNWGEIAKLKRHNIQ